MTDEHLRELERRWEETGADTDFLALVKGAQRAGCPEKYSSALVAFLARVQLGASRPKSPKHVRALDLRRGKSISMGIGGVSSGLVGLDNRDYRAFSEGVQDVIAGQPGFYVDASSVKDAKGLNRVYAWQFSRMMLQALEGGSFSSVGIRPDVEGGNPLLWYIAEIGLPIEVLVLNEMLCNAAAVRAVAGSPLPLAHLSCPVGRIGDDDVVYIAGEKPQLQTVNLSKNQGVTDAGAYALAGCRGLRNVGLSDTRVTDAGVERLAQNCRLRALHVSRTQVTDRSIDALLESGALLEELHVSSTQITQAAIERLYASDMPLFDVTFNTREDTLRFEKRAERYGGHKK